MRGAFQRGEGSQPMLQLGGQSTQHGQSSARNKILLIYLEEGILHISVGHTHTILARHNNIAANLGDNSFSPSRA